MARNHDTSESAPLLADRDANAGYASLDGTNDASSAGESAAIGSPVPPQAHAEEAGPNNEDEARAKQYEGMANARKQIPYILPAMGVGVRLAPSLPYVDLTFWRSSSCVPQIRPSWPRAMER